MGLVCLRFLSRFEILMPVTSHVAATAQNLQYDMRTYFFRYNAFKMK